MENKQQSSWQFIDQLRRLDTSNLLLSSTSVGTKTTDERRNFDIRAGGDINSSNNLEQKGTHFNGINNGWKIGSSDEVGPWVESQKNVGINGGDINSSNNLEHKGTDFNGFNDGWKIGSSIGIGPGIGSQKNVGINGGYKGIYSKPSNRNNNINVKRNKINGKGEDDHGGKGGRKNNNSNKNNNGDNNNNSKRLFPFKEWNPHSIPIPIPAIQTGPKSSVDKRFKSLPPSESLPRNETVGGYIFVCNNDTMQENLNRQLFGLPPCYRDSVQAITPGLPPFLYNYPIHQLQRIFEAASFGGTNIGPIAWEDRKCPSESRFLAQMRTSRRGGNGVRDNGSISYPIRKFGVRRVRVSQRVNTRKTRKHISRESEQEFISSGACHAIVIFVIPLLVGLLQVDSQSKDGSPFQTHPIYMGAFLIALCIYCIGLSIKKAIQTHCPNHSQISRHVTVISGAFSSVSLASIFLQRLLGKLVFFIWAPLLVMVARHVVLPVYQWLYQRTMKVDLQVLKVLKRIRGRNSRQLPLLPVSI